MPPIDASYQSQARHAGYLTLAMLAALFVLLALPISEDARRGFPLFLPLHVGLEMLSVAIAALIFGTVWSARDEALPQGIVVMACAFLGVALLDFSHTLSYKDMPGFVTLASADQTIDFWLAARLLGDAGLLAMGSLAPRPARKWSRPSFVLWGVLLLVAAIHALVLRAPGWLPRSFVPGQGITAAATGGEYLVVALSLLAALLFWRHLREPRVFSHAKLSAAACLMAMSEFLFIHYAQTTDFHTLAGHLYKVLAFVLLYQATFADTVRRPYRKLRATQTEMDAMLAALPDLLIVMDRHGRYLNIHAKDQEKLLALPHALVGQSVHDVMPAEQAAIAMSAIDEAMDTGASHGKVITLDVPAAPGRAFELSVARIATPLGEAPRFVVISRDVTQRLQNAESLRLFSNAVEQSPIAIMITDTEARISYVNATFTHVTGYSTGEVLGRNPRILQSGKTPAARYQAMWEQLLRGEPWHGELVNRAKDGAELIEWTVIYPLRDVHGTVTHYLAHKIDVTEERRANARIRQLQDYDQLTNLPGRRLLREHFEYARQHGHNLSLLWLDLDHFKDINDTLGHTVGDRMLEVTAQRLRSQLRAQDVVSRHSGDDFAILLPQTGQGDAAELAQRLLAALAEPIELAGQTLSTTASIGIALCPEDTTDFDTLLKNAETATYRVKQEGRNHYRFFTGEMQERAIRALALGNALKQALQREEFHLVYQPQMQLASGRIVGAEVLLRWTNETWGTVSPAEFIPIAESGGQIVAIGEWVLRTALAQLRQWIDEGLPPFVMAVNLSAVQFDMADLPERIHQLLQEAGVDARWLELELTEAVAMKDPHTAATHMHRLRELGLQLSIDDFGTGYSSLNYLKRFKVHKLKIDQSFVRDIHIDADDQAIVVAIIQLAHGLGGKTIAEGVETAEQQSFLQEQGCTEIQGHHFSRPLPAQAFAAFVREHAGAGDAA